MYRGADKSLARPGRKEATATEDFEFRYPICNHKAMYSYCGLCILIVVYVFLLLSMYSYC